MARREKILELLEASEFKKLLEQSEALASQFYTAQSNDQRALAIMSRFVARIRAVLTEIVVDLYMDMLTDAEVDELIAFHNSPVIKNMRDSAPRLQEKVLSQMHRLKFELDALIDETVVRDKSPKDLHEAGLFLLSEVI